jgi:hypothetical protein
MGAVMSLSTNPPKEQPMNNKQQNQQQETKLVAPLPEINPSYAAGYLEYQLRQSVIDCRDVLTKHEIEEAVRSALENG